MGVRVRTGPMDDDEARMMAHLEMDLRAHLGDSAVSDGLRGAVLQTLRIEIAGMRRRIQSLEQRARRWKKRAEDASSGD